MNKSMALTTLCLILFLYASHKEISAQGSSQKVELDSQLKNEELIQWVNHKIDSVIQKNNIPAVSVGIIKGGNVIMSRGHGVHNRNGELLASENSIYQIASDTKKLTGIIVRNLVSEGKLEISQSIVNYLPDSLEEIAKEKLKKITIADILHHKSGIPYKAPGDKRIDGEPMQIPYTEQMLLKDLNSIELNFEPGTKFSYSNFGYAIVGYICEYVSQKTYSELIQEYISEPYGMPNTTISLSQEQLKSLVTPYRKEDRMRETTAFNMGKLAAAGGAYSNINDLSHLMVHQINAYIEYQENGKLDNPLILTEHSGIKGDDYGFGLGKNVFETGTQYGHGGDLDGFASAYLFSPEYKSGVILLTSSGGKWVGELEKELFFKLTNRKYFPPKKSIAQELHRIILNSGFEEGKKWFGEYKNSMDYYLKEAELNNVGYEFLQQLNFDDAIKVFKLNVELYPESANAYDSLGEAYLKNGDEKLAMDNYEKSIKLNPKNENAIEILRRLKDK